ncbi:MAG TPA: hypothetical protein VMV94_07515 [Phycisphaerae bacterium]|nr:hypothetical protein [Phycisphaerae bacterium]
MSSHRPLLADDGRLSLIIILALLYVSALVTLGPTVQPSQWYVGPENNQGAAEARAWLDGRLDLPSRGGDVALYNGRYYNIFPPLWTVICFIVYGLNRLLFGEPLVFWPWLYALIVAGPIPLLFYVAFRRSGTSCFWAPVLAFYAIAGTCLWPVAGMIAGTRTAWIYSIQHLLAQSGLAIMLIDLLGRRRFWLAGLGVLIAAWSRQPCFLYALPVLWLASRSPNRRGALVRAAIPIAVALAASLGLNWARFGSPLESGYRYQFAGVELSQDNPIRGPDGQAQPVAWRYVRQHAYEMFVAPPEIDWTHNGVVITGRGPRTALWYGSPLCLVAVLGIRRWWPDPARRALMLSTLPVIFVALIWHGPIEGSPGYYRYVLDFGLIWLAAIAPWTAGPRCRWLTLACLAWSVFYFYMLGRA